MKWIGQHIWQFVSRFRDTVYFEKIDTSANLKIRPLFVNTATGQLYLGPETNFSGKGNTVTALPDSTATITGANLGGGIMTVAPASADITKPTDTATNIIGTAAMGLDTDESSFETTVINTNASNKLTISAGAGVTLVGDMDIGAGSSGTLRIKRTGSSAVSIYRTA
tara:strand:+ start:198 stop:698 length:501 start_codon:yes stop_codon:yes gene_type:complete